MSELKCPFCQRKLKTFAKYKDGTSTVYCSKCNLFGDSKLFLELIRTRKALGEANEKLRHCVNMTVEELDELKGNLLIAWNALSHFSKDPIANDALKKITALEQKDVK